MAKEVYLDFNGAIKELLKRGEEVDMKSTASEIGYTEAGLIKLRKKAPKAIVMIYNYLKDNSLEFEDLVKEREIN